MITTIMMIMINVRRAASARRTTRAGTRGPGPFRTSRSAASTLSRSSPDGRRGSPDSDYLPTRIGRRGWDGSCLATRIGRLGLGSPISDSGRAPTQISSQVPTQVPTQVLSQLELEVPGRFPTHVSSQVSSHCQVPSRVPSQIPSQL